MSVTIAGIVCQELVANYKEGYDILTGPTIQKSYLCNWTDRYTVAKGMLGLANTNSVGGSIFLQTPLQSPELPTAYARSIDIIPVGLPTQGANNCQWTNAIIYASFGCLPWSFSGIDSGFQYQQIDPATPLIYCKQDINTSTSWQSIPANKLKFASGNPLFFQTWQMPLFLASISLTFMRVPYYPAQQIFTAGKSPINSTTFLGLAAGYVFFDGSAQQESRDTTGNFTRDITYNFSYRNIPWDQQWDGVGQAFSQVQQLGGSPVIARSDFNTLIPQGYLL